MSSSICLKGTILGEELAQRFTDRVALELVLDSPVDLRAVIEARQGKFVFREADLESVLGSNLAPLNLSKVEGLAQDAI